MGGYATARLAHVLLRKKRCCTCTRAAGLLVLVHTSPLVLRARTAMPALHSAEYCCRTRTAAESAASGCLNCCTACTTTPDPPPAGQPEPVWEDAGGSYVKVSVEISFERTNSAPINKQRVLQLHDLSRRCGCRPQSLRGAQVDHSSIFALAMTL